MKGIATLLTFLSTVVGTTQNPPQFAQEITTHKITDSLYVLGGAGGNVAVYVWDPARQPAAESRGGGDHAQADPLRGEHALAPGSPRRQRGDGGRGRSHRRARECPQAHERRWFRRGFRPSAAGIARDSFVRFRKANALHMGDCYLKAEHPIEEAYRAVKAEPAR